MEDIKKKYRNLERVTKGIANHRRLEMMSLLKQNPEQSVSELAKQLNINFRTASDHTRKLVHGGLIMKRSDSVSIRHRLTKLGEQVLDFFNKISNE